MSDQGSHGWLKQASTSSVDVRLSYEEWASTYDKDLAVWGYQAPLETASLLKSLIPPSSTILDAGCGTGLVGAAIRHVGLTGDIDGIDLSPSSLEKARRRGIYRNLHPVDFQNLPLALDDNVYDALACVGVLTYVPDSESILREFARIVRPKGVIIVTQRNDLFEERAFDQTMKKLIDALHFSETTVNEPKQYLPKNPDFGSEIQVIYATLTVA